MPITKSAKKALRASKRKMVFNLKRKNNLQDTVKKYKKLVAAKKIEEARKMVPLLQKAIDKATKKGVIKKNTASRKKSNFVKVINLKA